MGKGWLQGMFGRGAPPPAPPLDVIAAFEQAAALHREGRLEEAGSGYARVLAMKHDHFDALHLSGVVHFQRGQYSEATRLIENAIALDAGHSAAHSNLGLVLQRLGRLQEALTSFERALAIEPAFIAAWFNRANALCDLDRPDEALASYDQVLLLNPDHAEAHNNRGLLLKALNRAEEALAGIDAAIAARPDYPEALNNRGTVLSALGRHDEALEDFDSVIAARPDYASAHNNRGATLGALSRLEDALVSYSRALEIDPDFAEAHYNRAAVFSRLKNHPAALVGYDRALALRPDYAEAANGRGTTLRDLGRLREALASHDHALEARPEFPEALDNRGVVLAGLGRHEEALACHDSALTLRPGFPAALSNRAAVLRETGERSAAIEAYDEALAADPGSLAIRFKRLISYIPVLARDTEEISVSRSQFLQETVALETWVASHEHDDAGQAVGAAQPFHLAYQEENNRDLLQRYGALCCSLLQGWQRCNGIPIVTQRPTARPRMRVGIVSAHIHDHSVWNAIVSGWLQQIDKRRFELEVFHLGTTKDAETERAAAHCEHFIDGDRRLGDWARAISERQPDVLIYPEVGMDITTPRLAGMRLAPVQIAAWGHPETTGFPTIDYYISAECFETADSQSHYSEKLVALPNLGCYYAPAETEDPGNEATVTPDDPGAPLFICPGTPFKYAPQHDAVFVHIAHRLADARFIFFTFESVPLLSRRLEMRLERAFSQAGLDSAKHVVFIPWQPKADFFALLRRADAFLDTIGFSGFNTAMQAIECGLPIVTCEGHFMRGKFASAILKRMQLGDLVNADDEEYVECAVRLAQDRQYNAAVRKRIASSRHVLFRDAAPVRALEDFLAGL